MKNRLSWFVFGLGVLAVCPAVASDYDFNFQGTDIFYSEISLQEYFAYTVLSNSDGSTWGSPFTLDAGDTVSATVTFDSLITIPASNDYGYISLEIGGPGQSIGIFGAETISFYNHGTPVGYTGYVSAYGDIGAFAIIALALDGTAATTFDKAVFAIDVSSTDIPGGTVIPAGPMHLAYEYTLPVPEPAQWSLMVAGLGLLVGAEARRRAKR